jgi:hypothetical protein
MVIVVLIKDEQRQGIGCWPMLVLIFLVILAFLIMAGEGGM